MNKDRTPTLRIAVAQLDGVADLDAAVAAHVALIARAADQGAALVVFPELSLTGYCAGALAADPMGGVVALDDPRLAPLLDACRDGAVSAVVGAPVAEDGARYLGAAQISRSGRVAGVYRKIHLSGEEQRWFRRGRARMAFMVDGWRIATGVCYDSSFPEHARGYARDGADVYLVSGAFPAGRSDARRAIYMPARALENTLYVAFSNFTGTHDGETYAGGGGVWGPDGALVADAGTASGLAVVDLQAETLRAARLATPMLADLAALREG